MAVQESAAQLSMTLKVQEYPTLKVRDAARPRSLPPLLPRPKRFRGAGTGRGRGGGVRGRGPQGAVGRGRAGPRG